MRTLPVSPVRLTLGFGLCLLLASPVAAQYLREAKLVEAKALAGSALNALQGCLQGKGAGATCTLSEVAGRVSVNAASGATGDGRWMVGTGSALTLGGGGQTTGIVTIVVVEIPVR